MRVYHFVNSKNGLNDICRRRLKISKINELNDPFEWFGMILDDAETVTRYADLKDGLSKFHGILCFSRSFRNPVQWSHYADKHRGLCLGFDISAELLKVNYVDERLSPNLDSMKAEAPEAVAHLIEIASTKFRHWEYEEEYRVLTTLEDSTAEPGLCFFDFGEKLLLREIIVGWRSEVSLQVLAEALGDLRDVEIFKAAPAPRTFEVDKRKF